jgi:hypothetical protein
MFKQQNIELQGVFEPLEFQSSKSLGKSECSNIKTSNYSGFLNLWNSRVQKAQAKVNVQTAKHQITAAF